jgi:hypothetical protein
LAGWQDRYPNLEARRQVQHDHIRETMVDATRDAQLVVAGTRGHGGFTGMLLGSSVNRYGTMRTADRDCSAPL